MLYVQIWQPDTCPGQAQAKGCLVHEAGDQDLPSPPGSLRHGGKIDTLSIHMASEPSANAGYRVMRYVSYEEALEIHCDHFLARPESTNIGKYPLSEFSKKQRRKMFSSRSFLRGVISQVQPLPHLCADHVFLGYTQAMYDAVRERNQRKNIATWLAWKVGNDVSDEDLQWVALGDAEKLILIPGLPPCIEPRVSTEREERMRSLTRVFKLDDVRWSIAPGNIVKLSYLRDWLGPETGDVIQQTCDDKFGPGKVTVG